ncbi:hypothetical protein RRG08_010920 [Elysia crispata]|uniref:Uncharacterized protein n=1 Tax=Elysia crispata TaxID=231223 RepID=A0AAE1A0D9_9GAST|nr:hypothetical protein RRG08_010920 [Elysia crispata]
MPRSRSALYLWTDPSRSSADVARGLMRTNVCIAANLIKLRSHWDWTSISLGAERWFLTKESLGLDFYLAPC